MNIELKGNHYQIYSSWKEVPLSSGIEYMKHYQEAKATSGAGSIRLKRALLQIFSDMPEDIVRDLSLPDLSAGYNIIHSLLCMPLPNEPLKEFEFEGVTYKAPETLVLPNGLEVYMHSANAEEIAQILTLCPKIQAKEYDELPELLATIFKPEGTEYEEKDAIKRAEHFKSLSMDKAMGAFFLLAGLSSSSLHNTLSSLAERQ